MPTLNELIAEKARIETLIAEQKPAAIAQVKQLMATHGITVADLSPKRVTRPSTVKYADGKGNTWAGRGKRPVWLRDALANGAALSTFQAQ